MNRCRGVAGSVRGFLDDVRDGMAEREEDIRAHFEEGIALDAPDLPWAHGRGAQVRQVQAATRR